MLLVCAFNVCANGYCYVSREINCFLKSFWVMSIKNAGFSKLETWFSYLFQFFIEGPLLAGYKLINNNRSFHRNTSFWIFWPILSELHSLKKVKFWGKIHCQFRCLQYTTLWWLICPFPKKLASQPQFYAKQGWWSGQQNC